MLEGGLGDYGGPGGGGGLGNRGGRWEGYILVAKNSECEELCR